MGPSNHRASDARLAVLLALGCGSCRSGGAAGAALPSPAVSLANEPVAARSDAPALADAAGIRAPVSVSLARGGIGFDDLGFARELRKKLSGGSDYVRWVEATHELWVTEPDSQAIEVFALPPGPKPTPRLRGRQARRDRRGPRRRDSGLGAVLGVVPTVQGAHCATSDDRGQVWVCDPVHGQLLVFKDAFPASRP